VAALELEPDTEAGGRGSGGGVGAGRWPGSEGELIAGAPTGGGSFAMRILREGKPPSLKEDVLEAWTCFNIAHILMRDAFN
jgi:hypothetical protein